MPSLARVLSLCVFLGLLAYAGLLLLATMVEPKEHEIVTTIGLHPKRSEPAIPSAGIRTRTAATATTADGADDLFDKLQSLPFER